MGVLNVSSWSSMVIVSSVDRGGCFRVGFEGAVVSLGVRLGLAVMACLALLVAAGVLAFAGRYLIVLWRVLVGICFPVFFVVRGFGVLCVVSSLEVLVLESLSVLLTAATVVLVRFVIRRPSIWFLCLYSVMVDLALSNSSASRDSASRWSSSELSWRSCNMAYAVACWVCSPWPSCSLLSRSLIVSDCFVSWACRAVDVARCLLARSRCRWVSVVCVCSSSSCLAIVASKRSEASALASSIVNLSALFSDCRVLIWVRRSGVVEGDLVVMDEFIECVAVVLWRLGVFGVVVFPVV